MSDVVAPILKDFGVRSILDFGAGALRHAVPLLSLGFDVYVVEFEACYTRPAVAAGLHEARKYPNFTSLIWPLDFAAHTARFDAILLDKTEDDIRKGFVYKRVPHVTLKSIANNPDIKEGMTREEIDAAIARHAETELLYD